MIPLPKSPARKSAFVFAAMSPLKKSLGAVSHALLACSLFAACQDSTSPGGDSVQADLKELATKVQTFSAQGRPSGGPSEKRSALAKRTDIDWMGCVDGITVLEEPATAEDPSYYKDTTWSYTAEGRLLCNVDGRTAYELIHSYARDAKTEYWLKGRIDYGSVSGAYLHKFSATGRVHYFSGYDIEIKSMEMVYTQVPATTEYKLVLGLEDGKYTATLGFAPGVDITQMPSADTVVLTGAIMKGAAIVGYFEIMGDDRVVIRDEARNIVAAH